MVNRPLPPSVHGNVRIALGHDVYSAFAGKPLCDCVGLFAPVTGAKAEGSLEKATI